MITLTPAYGRDYKSKQAVLNDFYGGKDFLFHDYASPWNGKPINLAQCNDEGYHAIQFRYGGNRKTFFHKIDAEDF